LARGLTDAFVQNLVGHRRGEVGTDAIEAARIIELGH
jgi:hypothetical protein